MTVVASNYARKEWRPIPDWPSYEVSSDGQVRRLAGTPKCRAGRVLEPHLNSNGYPTVHLRENGREKQMAVHRAVLLAFRGLPPTPLHEGAHGDGNPLNATLENLRWATRAENEADKREHGTLLFGEAHPSSRLSDGQVKQAIKMRREGAQYKEIASAIGCSKAHAWRLVQGERRGDAR